MKYYYSFMLAAVLLTACTGTETFLPETEGEANVPLTINSLDMSVETKAVMEDIGNDKAANHLEEIGVLVTKADDKGATVLYSVPVVSQKFTFDGSTWTPDVALNLGSAEGTLYAWAPETYKSTLSSEDPAKPQIKSLKILADQTVSAGENEWETEQEDFLYGSAASAVGDVTHPTVSKSAPKVDNIYMQHALGKISFKIIKAAGLTVNTDDYVKKIELSSGSSTFQTADGTSETSVMSLVDGSLDGLTGTSALSMTMSKQAQAGTYSADYSTVTHAQAYGLVAPGSMENISLKLTMGPSGTLNATTDRTYQAKSAIANVTWEKGKHYVYRIAVSDLGLEIATVEVIGWTDAGNTDVPVE